MGLWTRMASIGRPPKPVNWRGKTTSPINWSTDRVSERGYFLGVTMHRERLFTGVKVTLLLKCVRLTFRFGLHILQSYMGTHDGACGSTEHSGTFLRTHTKGRSTRMRNNSTLNNLQVPILGWRWICMVCFRAVCAIAITIMIIITIETYKHRLQIWSSGSASGGMREDLQKIILRILFTMIRMISHVGLRWFQNDCEHKHAALFRCTGLWKRVQLKVPLRVRGVTRSFFLDRRCRVRYARCYGGGDRIADRNAGRWWTVGWRFLGRQIIFVFNITLDIVFTIAKRWKKKTQN